jgi:hypothetical protein
MIFMQRYPSVASELGLCVDVYARVEHKEVVGIDVQIAYLLSYFLIRQYCGMKQPELTLLVLAQETSSTE